MLFAARSAVALYRLLDTLPVFAGDPRITRLFTLIPGSDFAADALAALDAVGGRSVPWAEACAHTHDLVIAASPKGDVLRLRGPHLRLPHGAGFNKSIPEEGSQDSASGLDPHHLLPREHPTGGTTVHALAHPGQLTRLATAAPEAARRARVIGDPTLDRLLASRSHRDAYRTALGTGPRRLIALTSTWGPDSLLARRPSLPAELAAHLPYDGYQLALIVHPNEHSLLGAFELGERLAPAVDAGLVTAAAYQEWAAVLVAADVLITDHGSSALYYAAVGDRPVVGVHRGGAELIPGTPMHQLLAQVPQLGTPETVCEAVAAYPPGAGPAAARAAFAARGEALHRLRVEAYRLLELDLPRHPVAPTPLPRPAGPGRRPGAFDVHTEILPEGIRIDRRPAGLALPARHLAAEYGVAGEHWVRSAGLLFRRPPAATTGSPGVTGAGGVSWTADGWARHVLEEYPGCRVAGTVLPSGACLVGVWGRDTVYRVEAAECRDGGRLVRADPAVALSALYAWCAGGREPGELDGRACLVGGRSHRLSLRPATEAEAAQAV
ncbi:translation initiation factor 2 [Streptomyces sp. NPDC058045]|uniref:translation initiation factor 2 n=1 Tax=Streptomyces sp. NPDC058045 TaxID=3346311 RepID=UPI0036E841D4